MQAKHILVSEICGANKTTEINIYKCAINYCKELGIKYKVKKITLPLTAIGVYNLYPPTFFLKKSIIRRYVLEKEKDINRVKEITQKSARLREFPEFLMLGTK